jgi:hypothetical protein
MPNENRMENIPPRYIAMAKLVGGLRAFLNDCYTRKLKVTLDFDKEEKDGHLFRVCRLASEEGEEYTFSIRKDKLKE